MDRVVCIKCCMDRSAQEINFDKQGICNFCHQAQRALKEIEKEKPNLSKVIERIKKDGKGKKYDVIAGVSGGVDSSTALHYAVQYGLRPLCFNVDNGWNSPESDENVLRLVEGLKVPFYRYTIDLERFRELQAAFMRAGQINIEIPTDHILMATSYEMANKYNVKWILSGGNVATESIMPESFGYQPRDLRHIKDVYRKMIKKKLKGLPVCGLLKFNWYKWIGRIKTLYLLDYMDYNRVKSIKLLEEKYGWKDYGNKHEESVFTKWFQSYYLFEKFGIDKRKAHYASLINSGQMTREEAMEALKSSPEYPKLGIEERAIKYEIQPYTNFKTDEKLWRFLTILIRLLRNPYRRLIRIGENMKA